MCGLLLPVLNALSLRQHEWRHLEAVSRRLLRLLQHLRPLCFSVYQGTEHQKVLRVPPAIRAASVSQGLHAKPISAVSWWLTLGQRQVTVSHLSNDAILSLHGPRLPRQNLL